jgi:hypothetical protein
MTTPATFHSQFGEDAIVEKIFEQIGTRNKYCFEVGAGDGISLSNSRHFILSGWSAVLVESDGDKAKKLKKNYNHMPRVRAVRAEVGEITIDDILGKIPGPWVPYELDLVSIDIDGQDYYVWSDMEKYSGRIVIVEFNCYDKTGEVMPPRGAPHLDGRPGNFENQAGENHMLALAESKGYQYIARTVCNLIFVLKSEIKGSIKI